MLFLDYGSEHTFAQETQPNLKGETQGRPKKRSLEDREEIEEQLETKEDENGEGEQEEALNTVCPICFGEYNCEESRVYKRSLNFTFKTEKSSAEQSKVDSWHNDRIRNLSQIITVTGKKLLNKNLALAGLSLAYEYNGEIQFTHIYDIPIIFSSGEFAELDPVEEKPIKTVSSFFPHLPGPPALLRQQLEEQMHLYLEKFFKVTDEHPSRMLKNSLDSRAKEVNETTKPGFKSGYYHSEQALLLYLQLEMGKWLPDLLKGIPQGATIYLLNINIVSDRQMCFRCSSTFLRWAENVTEFNLELGERIRDTHYEIPQEKIGVLVEVSGIKPFQRPNKKIRRQQAPHRDENVEVKATSPHVIQQKKTLIKNDKGKDKGE
jgi:hypothetical protein